MQNTPDKIEFKLYAINKQRDFVLKRIKYHKDTDIKKEDLYELLNDYNYEIAKLENELTMSLIEEDRKMNQVRYEY